MKLQSLLLLPLLWCGCSAPRPPGPPATALTVTTTETPEAALTVKSFKFIGLTTTMPDVIHTLGSPQQVREGQITVYVYRLVDNSTVLIETTSPERILFVRHRGKVLFQR